jgi:DNA-binding transcriptional LysR family regulator
MTEPTAWKPGDPLVTRLKLRQLALVVALAERRSLRQAACAIAITQPAATKLLRDLETAIGLPLFTRHAWGMTPTAYGDAFVRHARSLITGVSEARDELAALAAGATGALRVGGVTGAVPGLLAPAIRRMRAERPGVNLFVLVNTTDVMAEGLRLGTLDLAVGPVASDTNTTGLRVERLMAEPLCIVARAKHPWSKRRSLSLGALIDAVWLLQPPGSPLRRDVDAMLAAESPRSPTSIVETVSMVATLALLQEIDAVTVIPRALARHYTRFGMVTELPVKLVAPRSRYELVTRADRELSPAAAAFVAMLKESQRTGGTAQRVR